jgi:NADH:ubiquinone oxidoreductase subunit C
MDNRYIYLLANKDLILLKILCDDISIKVNDLLKIGNFFHRRQHFLLTGTCVDQIDKQNRFLVVYVFTNYILGKNVYITTNTAMVLPSLANVYPSGIWIEREIYDLFGVYFTTNKSGIDLRRILTDYHFKGHPMRKDFSLIGYGEKLYSPTTKGLINRHNIAF